MARGSVAKIDRSVKITVTVTKEHLARLEALGAAMGQPMTVAAQVAMTLGLTNLEVLYQLKDMRGAVDAALEPLARDAVSELRAAGLPMGEPNKLTN